MKDDKLIVPAYDARGNLTTVQLIGEDGEKRFLKGGQVRGSSFSLSAAEGNEDAAIYLAEGLATGVSIWLALGKSAEVRVCFSAGNLLPVALSIQKKYPARDFIICADNDRFTSGNPGLTKALDAAAAVRSRRTAFIGQSPEPYLYTVRGPIYDRPCISAWPPPASGPRGHPESCRPLGFDAGFLY